MKEIFLRMDMQQIRAFLLNGEETCEIENAAYDVRIKERERAIYHRLKSIYKNDLEYEKATGDLYEALTAYEEVYTEIGMKFAAKLIFQLLQ